MNLIHVNLIHNLSNRYFSLVQKYEAAKAVRRFGLADDYAVAAAMTSGWLIHHGVQESTITDLRSRALAAMADSDPIDLLDQRRPEMDIY